MLCSPVAAESFASHRGGTDGSNCKTFRNGHKPLGGHDLTNQRRAVGRICKA
jgi:hypothetical protein